MAWIRVIDEADATGHLKRTYDQAQRQAGAVANILKIHSLAPATLSAHLGLYAQVMHAPGELTRAQREMIAVVVSVTNGCHY